MKIEMTMTSSPSLSSGKCWLQLRVEQPDAQAHGDRAHVLADADAEGTIPCPPDKEKGMVMTTILLSRSNKVEVTIISHPLFPREGRKCDHDIPPPRSLSIPSQSTLPEFPHE